MASPSSFVCQRHLHGCGFSIVRQLVDAHRGTVTATSVPGTETVFTLRLPAGS
ncbi:ATP-binding protein [Streptomyces sp. 2A115]|uniref:ATP-binding protein n=1 Tax=Streptomyces sp. 2A115 TaxID=3457439 RepID=UPI003FCFF2D6